MTENKLCTLCGKPSHDSIELDTGYTLHICNACLEVGKTHFIFLCIHCGKVHARNKKSMINRMPSMVPNSEGTMVPNMVKRAYIQNDQDILIQGISGCINCIGTSEILNGQKAGNA